MTTTKSTKHAEPAKTVNSTDIVEIGEDVSLEDLKRIVPEVNRALQNAIFVRTNPEKLIKEGQKITSSTILSEGPKLIAKMLTVWNQLSEPLQKLLRINVPTLSALAIHELEQMQESYELHQKAEQASSVGHAQYAAQSKKLRTECIELRDEVAELLGKAIGHDEPMNEMLDTSIGTAETNDDLVKGLRSLNTTAKQIQKMLGSDSEVLFETLGITDSMLDSLNHKASELDTLIRTSNLSPQERANLQRKLDLIDGRALYLLDVLVRAFMSAHEKDPRIVRVLPNRLKSFLGPQSAKKGAKAHSADGTTKDLEPEKK